MPLEPELLLELVLLVESVELEPELDELLDALELVLLDEDDDAADEVKSPELELDEVLELPAVLVEDVELEPLLPDDEALTLDELATWPALHTWVTGSQTTQLPSAQASPWAQSVVTLHAPKLSCGGVLVQPPSSSG